MCLIESELELSVFELELSIFELGLSIFGLDVPIWIRNVHFRIGIFYIWIATV